MPSSRAFVKPIASANCSPGEVFSNGANASVIIRVRSRLRARSYDVSAMARAMPRRLISGCV